MRGAVHIGTSGWSYAHWDGVFYPPGVRGASRLGHYARHFDTLELNASFYRTPTAAMVEAWNRRLDPGFHLVAKGLRTITHMKKLSNVEQSVSRFLDRILGFRTLRVVLWHLPPQLRKDVARLEAFLDLLARLRTGVRHAVEFRHESWWDDDVVDCLRRHGVAFTAISHPSLPRDVIPTADFLYVRFHGLGPQLCNYDYSAAELGEWADALRPHQEGRALYAYFNNDLGGYALSNAVTFRELLLGRASAAG